MQDKLTLPFTKKQALHVMIPVLFVMLMAFMAYLFTDMSTQWYLELVKPQMMLGNAVFLIIWGVMYILLTFIYSLISLKVYSQKTVILMLLAGLMNPFWCLVFFTAYHALAAIFVVLIMITAAIYLAYSCYTVKPFISYLMLPYIFWLAFILTINYQIVILN